MQYSIARISDVLNPRCGSALLIAVLGEGVTTMSDPSFARDIRPLFRAKDREAMRYAFDLWSIEDARDNAEAILAAVRSGTMPCDGAWPVDDVSLFEAWINAGMVE